MPGKRRISVEKRRSLLRKGPTRPVPRVETTGPSRDQEPVQRESTQLVLGAAAGAGVAKCFWPALVTE